MKNKFSLTLTLALVLSSCTAADFRKSIGVEKDSPDEFLVQPRARLKIPTQAITLPAPQKKIDEALVAKQSGREALYGESAKNNVPVSAAEKALLAKTGAETANSKVRKKVEKEYKAKTGVFGTERGGMMEAILDPFRYNAPVDPVVDPKEENKRIREALQKGEKINPEGVKSYNPAKEKAQREGVL
jgi:Protein of unknown function (DUF3035)